MRAAWLITGAFIAAAGCSSSDGTNGSSASGAGGSGVAGSVSSGGDHATSGASGGPSSASGSGGANPSGGATQSGGPNGGSSGFSSQAGEGGESGADTGATAGSGGAAGSTGIAGSGGVSGSAGSAGIGGVAGSAAGASGNGGSVNSGGNAGHGGSAGSPGGGAGGSAGSGVGGSSGAGGAVSAPILVGFAPALSAINVGVTGSTVPPLKVTLSSPAQTDTVITLSSNDTQHLAVSNVTVPMGQTSWPVTVNGIAQAADVTLTAKLSNTLTADVRVVGNAEARNVASLLPAIASMNRGGTEQLTVSLDVPAPPGGQQVTLTLTPTNAGVVPATVVVPANEISGTFGYQDGSTVSSVVVTATLGSSSASSTLAILTAGCTATHLLISEIKSRGAGGSADEFVELYNPTTSPITLDSSWTINARANTSAAYSSRWVGTGKVIPAHGHFLIASTGYTATPAADEMLANGITDANSIVLQHSASTVDAVCYAFDAASLLTLTTDSTFICEGTPALNPHNNTATTNTDASIERKPGGSAGNCADANDNSVDFASITPSQPQSSASAITP